MTNIMPLPCGHRISKETVSLQYNEEYKLRFFKCIKCSGEYGMVKEKIND